MYCIIICGGGGKTNLSQKYPNLFLDIDDFMWNYESQKRRHILQKYVENNNIIDVNNIVDDNNIIHANNIVHDNKITDDNNIIDENLEFKIKLDIKLLGFIGFNKIYQCVKCFINPDTKIINERLLINTTIFIENEKLKYLIESIFYLLKPTKPILIKTKNKDETLDYSQTDKDSAIELTEDDLKDKLNISNIDEIKLHN